MNNASLELGGTNWAEKDASLLGYTVSDDSGRFFPQEFTFSRGSNLAATRIGKTGLIEKGRENLVLQSNSFDTTWAQNRVDLTSGQSGYDGGSNAWQLQSNDASTTYLQQSVAVSGVQTISLYAKVGTADYLAFYASSGARAWFNLNSGSISSSSSNIDTQIENVGNGWYRCSMSYNASTTYVRIYVADVNANFTSAIGANIYIQDAQLEQGLAASPYIPTTTTTAQAGVLENTPRLNYTTGVANPSLLLEPSRTNLVRYSEYYEGTGWILGTGVLTSNTTETTSPEGLYNAAKFVDTNNGAQLYHSGMPVTASTQYTFSFYAKGDIGTPTLAVYDESNGAFILVDIAYSISEDSWTRIEETITTPVGCTSLRVYPIRGTGSGTIYFYGAQVELGSYPTSYIPTYSVSATRGQDTCIKTDATGEINSTEGVLFIEGKVEEEDSFAVSTLSISDGTDSNRLSILQYRSSPLIRASMNVGGATQFDMQIGGQTRGLYYKIAAVYSENNCSLFINGVKIGNDTSATMPSPNTFNKIGFVIAADQYNYQGNVKQVLLYPTALTDAEAITLTTP